MIENPYLPLIEKAKSQKKHLRKLFTKLSIQSRKALDSLFHNEHEEVFQEIDCLLCANCCKTTSPIFRDVDIKRLAVSLNLKPAIFIEQYLRLDHEGDYVLIKSPCAFLDENNYCSVYEHRPLACREYPHTDRKNMHQILDLTRVNATVCPAVVEVLDRIEKVI